MLGWKVTGMSWEESRQWRIGERIDEGGIRSERHIFPPKSQFYWTGLSENHHFPLKLPNPPWLSSTTLQPLGNSLYSFHVYAKFTTLWGKLIDCTTIFIPQKPKLKNHKNSFPWIWHITFPFIVVFSLHIIMVSLNFPWQGVTHPFRLPLRCVWAANSALLVSFYQHAKRNNLKLCYTCLLYTSDAADEAKRV